LNKNGYHFQYEIDVSPTTVDLVTKTYDGIWREFVFSLLGEECDSSEEINGFRFLYKYGRHVVRIEVWISEVMPKSAKNKGETSPNQEEVKRKNVYDNISSWMQKKIQIYRPEITILPQACDHSGK